MTYQEWLGFMQQYLQSVEKYSSIYSGQQIDTAIGKALNPDTTPTASSSALITSGAVQSALISQTVSSSTQPSGGFYYAQWEVYRTAGLVAIAFDIVYNGTTTSNWVKIGEITDSRYLPRYRASGVVLDATSKAVTNMSVEPNGDIKISGMTYGHEYWNTIVYLY